MVNLGFCEREKHAQCHKATETPKSIRRKTATEDGPAGDDAWSEKRGQQTSNAAGEGDAETAREGRTGRRRTMIHKEKLKQECHETAGRVATP